MGFWQTGYWEFHEPTGIDFVIEKREITYPCRHCARIFKTMDDLQRHRFEDHAYSRPVLFLRGTEVGASAFAIRRRLAASEVKFDHVRSAVVNGRSVAPKELPKRLAEVLNDRVMLEFANEGASARFELVFDVASEAHLKGVESAFLRLAHGRTLSLQAIEGFIGDCAPFRTAAGYLDGICHYLYGVMAKERAPDSGLPFDAYRKRYSRAADELKGFDRPLASMVQALVAFHFNHFDDAQQLAPEGRLRHAAVSFAGVLEGWPWHHAHESEGEQSTALEDLLTDHETFGILRWAALGVHELKSRYAEIAARLDRDIPGFDRLKLQIMLAEALAAKGDRSGARAVARELIGNTQTTAWAESLLARLAVEGVH